MTIAEQKFMDMVPHYLREIAKQLAIANDLKALELKDKGLAEAIVDNIVSKDR